MKNEIDQQYPNDVCKKCEHFRQDKSWKKTKYVITAFILFGLSIASFSAFDAYVNQSHVSIFVSVLMFFGFIYIYYASWRDFFSKKPEDIYAQCKLHDIYASVAWEFKCDKNPDTEKYQLKS